MSSRQASLTNSAAKAQNVRKLRKFKFTDLSLSYQVRKKLYEMLISFDDNVNYQFQKQQIKQALIQILQQTQSQVSYVINNVFRYDLNHDGIVTYEQFSNFCLEQHFGEMAIQRLHKQGIYALGKQRIMSFQQFVKTVNYCMSFISVHPRLEIVRVIFNDVDKDADNYISYSDYFTFLKQYFGSQSQSASIITVNTVQDDLKKQFGNVDKKKMKQEIFKQKYQKIQKQDQQKRKKMQSQDRLRRSAANTTSLPLLQPFKPTQTIMKPDSTKTTTTNGTSSTTLAQPKNIEQLKIYSQRISRLIYQQLKIVTIDQDHKMLLYSDEQIIKQFLTNIIKTTPSTSTSTSASSLKINQTINELQKKNQKITYQKLLKYTIQKYTSQDMIQKYKYPLNKQQFVNNIIQSLYFVKVKPFRYIFQDIFDKYCEGRQRTQITKQQCKQLMNIIFGNYSWPRLTGQLRKKAPLSTKIQNYHIVRY